MPTKPAEPQAPSAAKYTPGPWKIRGDWASNEIVAQDDGNCDHGHTIEEIEANARLIAKAPEMAEALRRLILWLNNSPAFEQRLIERAERVLREAGVL